MRPDRGGGMSTAWDYIAALFNLVALIVALCNAFCGFRNAEKEKWSQAAYNMAVACFFWMMAVA
jgi:hypothetical protein